MAIDPAQHSRPARNMDPAQDDRAPDQINDDGTPGSDTQLEADLQDTQTGGSRNERVTEFSSNRHATEPAAGASGRPGYQGAGGAEGITNRPLSQELAEQQKLKGSIPNKSADEDQRTYSSADPENEQAGALPTGMAERVETVEISDLRAKR